jgi:Tol biopolymer transport system component
MKTGQETWLTHVRTYATHAAWSPLGNEIAFSSTEGVFLIGPDGNGFKRLTHTGRNAPCYDDSGVTWSPDGSQIAFARTDCEFVPSAIRDDSGIYVMNADGSGLHLVFHSDSTQLDLGDITWSPDSATLAFDYTGGVYVISPDGTGLRPLVLKAQSPVWSPDGGAIGVMPYFVGGLRRPGVVLIVDTSGRKLAAVRLPPATQVTGFAWSSRS